MAARRQEQLCLITYRSAGGEHVHAVVTTAQRVLLAQVGRLAADHGLVDHGMPTKEVQAAMRELKAAMATDPDLVSRVVPKPAPWDLRLDEQLPAVCICTGNTALDTWIGRGCPVHDQAAPECTCLTPAGAMVVDPACPVHRPPGGGE